MLLCVFESSLLLPNSRSKRRNSFKAPHLTTDILPRIDVTCGELVGLHSEKLTVKALERPPLPPQLDQPLAMYYVL